MCRRMAGKNKLKHRFITRATTHPGIRQHKFYRRKCILCVANRTNCSSRPRVCISQARLLASPPVHQLPPTLSVIMMTWERAAAVAAAMVIRSVLAAASNITRLEFRRYGAGNAEAFVAAWENCMSVGILEADRTFLIFVVVNIYQAGQQVFRPRWHFQ